MANPTRRGRDRSYNKPAIPINQRVPYQKSPKATLPLCDDGFQRGILSRIADAAEVNAQLEAKWPQIVTSGSDLGISANTATKKKKTLQRFCDSFPGWGMAASVETNNNHSGKRIGGELVVDLCDAHQAAQATDPVYEKPEKNTKKLSEAVEKMFKGVSAEGYEVGLSSIGDLLKGRRLPNGKVKYRTPLRALLEAKRSPLFSGSMRERVHSPP